MSIVRTIPRGLKPSDLQVGYRMVVFSDAPDSESAADEISGWCVEHGLERENIAPIIGCDRIFRGGVFRPTEEELLIRR